MNENMMLEKDKIRFFPCENLTVTAGIKERCTIEYLENKLSERFPEKQVKVLSASINESGKHIAKGDSFNKLFGIKKSIEGLPAYCSVELLHCTGEFEEKITIWSPIAWNERFAGTAGGGTGTGGNGYLISPDNTSRGWMVPYAVMNGFTAATADAGNSRGFKDFMLDTMTGEIRNELYENWRKRTTHHMTVFGKAVAEILHEKKVLFSYMSGGSGGGRQCVVEAQEYPDDYDGIWASCPAINWNKFVLEGLWYLAVMNSCKSVIHPKKLQYFTEKVWESAGGKEAYFRSTQLQELDPYKFIGEKTSAGIITELDAKIVSEFWKGPHDQNGNRKWYGFRPGVVFWKIGIPIGAFYYSIIKRKPKPFFLSTFYARWVTGNSKQKFDQITIPEYLALFEKSISKFESAGADQSDLSAFFERNGKLIIDHGFNDPLIPVDGTIDYFNKVCQSMGGINKVREFMKLYLTPGDGHGNCWDQGPGITQSMGMEALINWVEKGIEPGALRTVQVNKKTGALIRESMIEPASIDGENLNNE